MSQRSVIPGFVCSYGSERAVICLLGTYDNIGAAKEDERCLDDEMAETISLCVCVSALGKMK